MRHRHRAVRTVGKGSAPIIARRPFLALFQTSLCDAHWVPDDMFWNRDPTPTIVPWTGESPGEVQRQSQLPSMSADAPPRKTSVCPVLPLPHAQQPLRLSASWTTGSSATATKGPNGSTRTSSAYSSSPSSHSSHEEDDLEDDEGLIARFPTSAARADPIAPFTANAVAHPPWRSQLQFPADTAVESKPSKSSRLLGITPTDAKFPHSVTLNMESPSPTFKLSSDSPTTTAFPSFPCQREQVLSKVVLEGDVIKAQQNVSTSARSFPWRKVSGKRQVVLTSTVGGVNEQRYGTSAAQQPPPPPPSGSTSANFSSSTMPALTEGCLPMACLHAFKPSAPQQEVERLVLTPQSFIAVASGSPDAHDDCITSLLWAVRVSGIHFDQRGLSATCKMEEWFLQLSTQREMVIWQSTIRSIINALARIDSHFRLGSPQGHRPQQQEEHWSSCLSPSPLTASFSHTSSPMPFTPPSGSLVPAQSLLVSPMILPSSAEPLLETVRKLNLATAEARKASTVVGPVAVPVTGTKTGIVKEAVEPPKRPPRPPSPLKIFIPRNEQSVKARSRGGVEAMSNTEYERSSAAMQVNRHRSSIESSPPVHERAATNQTVPTPAPLPIPPTPMSTQPLSAVKDYPTFGWTVDVSQSPDEFYERHVSPVTHWRGRWGGSGSASASADCVTARGPTSAHSSISTMEDDRDCEEKIRDSLDLERPQEHSLSSLSESVAPIAQPDVKRVISVVARSRSGSVSSVGSAATLPPPRPPPMTPLPDVPRTLRLRSTSVGERHMVSHNIPLSAPPTAWKGATTQPPPLPLLPPQSAPIAPPRSASLSDGVQESRPVPEPQLAVSLGVPRHQSHDSATSLLRRPMLPLMATSPSGSPAALPSPSPDGGQSNFLNLSDGGLDSASSSVIDAGWPSAPATAVIGHAARPRRRNTTAHTYEVKKSLWEVVYFASRYSAPEGRPYADDYDLVTPTSPPL